MDQIIGVDPGKVTGIAIFNGDGTLDTFGQLSIEEVIELTDGYLKNVSVIVVEDFILFKKRALQQAGSRLHASQVIGMMKVFARQKNARLVMQPAERKNDGANLSQKFPPSDHSQSHQVDAYNHAFFWMHQAGIVRSALEVERLGK